MTDSQNQTPAPESSVAGIAPVSPSPPADDPLNALPSLAATVVVPQPSTMKAVETAAAPQKTSSASVSSVTAPLRTSANKPSSVGGVAPAAPSKKPSATSPKSVSSGAAVRTTGPVDVVDSQPVSFRTSVDALLKRTPGFVVSLVLHGVIFAALALIVIPPETRQELFTSIIAENVPLQEINEKLDDSILLPDAVESTLPQLEVDSKIVSNTPSALDLDVSDAAPQIEGPDLGSGGIGNGPNMPKGGGGELAGRSVKARGAMIRSQGGTAASEVAVNGSLKWLARHQKPNGSWSFKHGPDDPGTLDNPNGATGMALLAFLGGGHTHKAGDYQKQVSGGLGFLVSNMKVTGAGGDLRMPGDGQGMYTQGICTIALCEAYALSKDKSLKQPTQLAVNFIVNAQDPKGGGWRYEPGQPGDTSVVGWQIMALKSAKIAKLQVPNKTIGKATYFLNNVQTEGGAKYGYDTPGAGIGTTSVGLLCRMYLGWTPKNAGLAKGVEFLGATGPQPQNMYFNYYATQVLHHWGGEPWTKWNNVMREYLVTSQEKAGDSAGSWKPVGGGHDEAAGGRLYRTCLSVMTLEVYYRHLPLYQREGIKVEL